MSMVAQKGITMLVRCAVFLIAIACTGCTTRAVRSDNVRILTFAIDMREEIAQGRFNPARDLIGVRGGQPPLNWQTSMRAELLGDGQYRLRAEFLVATDHDRPIQYKFKIDRPGLGPGEGWEAGSNRIVTLDSRERTVARKWNAPGMGIAVRRTGHIDVIPGFASRHVAARTVQVWLPPNYVSEPNRRFPVLYLHDGQMKFDAAAAGAEWQMDETAHRLTASGEIDPFIIVAADHSGNQRILDYTPTASLLSAERLGMHDPRRVGGGAGAYAHFLKTELKPMIDTRYRTLPDRTNTAVGGASLGGLVSLWLALHHEDTFGAALVVSPSVWWDEEFALRDAQKVPTAQLRQTKIWLDMGAHEGAEAIPAVRRLRDVLAGKVELRYLEDPEGSHDESSWARRVPAMLQFLYGRNTAPQ